MMMTLPGLVPSSVSAREEREGPPPPPPLAPWHSSPMARDDAEYAASVELYARGATGRRSREQAV